MKDFDFAYSKVPETYREFVTPRPKKNLREVKNPLVLDLLAGKTLLLDASIPLGEADSSLKTLYSFFNARGMRLRMHLFDYPDKDIWRGLLMWVESFYRVYRCDRCKKITGVAGDTRPSRANCSSKRWVEHYWRERTDGYAKPIEVTHRVKKNKIGTKISVGSPSG
jgi:hypothetical protein